MRKYLWVAAFSAAAALLAAGLVNWLSRPPQGEPVTLLPPPTPGPILVYVAGAVNRPGVYALLLGERIQDAVQAAGGLTSQANSQQVNLAALVSDGQKVVVPFLPTAQPPGASKPGKTPTPTIVYPLDINTATLEELDSLPGIGPVTAQKILTYRQENGLFQKALDIMKVPGIGQATFDEIKSMITVKP